MRRNAEYLAPTGFANLFQFGASTAADAVRRTVNKAPVYRGKSALGNKILDGMYDLRVTAPARSS